MTQDSTGEPDEVVTKLSPRSVPDTVARLTGILSDKGLKLFAVIDQSAEASQAECACGTPPRSSSAVRPQARR